MNRKSILFFTLYVVFTTLFGTSVVAMGIKPYGLMTDLMEHTDKTWQNGYMTNIMIWQIDKVKGPLQYAQIMSSKPSFSWIVGGEKQNTYQTAYHVVVSDNYNDVEIKKGMMWNSGWVKNNQSTAVVYQGKPLQPNKVYFWRVKIKTNADGESDWSDIKAFRTAPSLSDCAPSYYPLVKSNEYPVSFTSPSPNVFLADFGKDAFGQLTLTLFSDRDKDTVQVHLGERLSNGRVNRKPGGTIRYSRYLLPLLKGVHTYHIKIAKDARNTSGSAILMPSYIGEVMPFRYCEIDGHVISLKKGNIVREAVHYPFDDNASSFSCSNDTLNKVYDLCKYSIKATSFTGVYIDGDRERTPYAADAYINQLGHYNADREYSMARRSYYYILNHPTWPTEWILQTVLIAWNDYLYTGDNSMLLATYEQLKPYLLKQLQEKNGLISTTTGLQTHDFLESIKSKGKIRDIVDWPSSGQGLNEKNGGEADGFVFTDYNAVVNAYYYEGLKVMAEIAKAVGKSYEAGSYLQQANELKSHFNHSFWNENKGCYQDGISTTHASLHSNIFPLAFGMVSDENRQSVIKYIETHEMACSVYGAQFLLDALYNAGDADYALRMLTKTDDRSWYNMLRAGSTITMEAWDNKYKPNQDWNHAWGSAPANTIPMKLMGVEPLIPGYSLVRIKPQIGSLKWANAVIPTIRGAIHIKVENKRKLYMMQLNIPANMNAELYLPLISSKCKVTDNGKPLNNITVEGESPMYFGRIVSGSHSIVVSF